jgi:hypothetical protein
MHIITAASTVSDVWDEAPSMFSVTLTENEIKRIRQLQEMIKDQDDIVSIDMRIYGQSWSKSYSLIELEDGKGNYCFTDEEDDLITDGKELTAIESIGGIEVLQKYIEEESKTQRVECQEVTIYSHGTIYFNAIPRHCGDSMKIMSNSLRIEDLEFGKIYLDGV